MPSAIAFMAGVSFLALGLSYLFNPGDWIAWIAHLQKQGRRGSLTIGMIHLLIGSFILGFHWQWAGVSLVLSVLGSVVTVEGAIYMLFPSLLPRLLEWLEPHCRGLMLFWGLFMLILAGAAFGEWHQLMWPDCVDWKPCFNQALQ